MDLTLPHSTELNRIVQLRRNELDLKTAIGDTREEIEGRFILLSDLLDELRANRAEQLRLQRKRAEDLDFLAGVSDTFGPSIADVVAKQLDNHA
jgi:hypothetical protein